jgi:septal ring factor EnvC (AmiA/AmiB activator)
MRLILALLFFKSYAFCATEVDIQKRVALKQNKLMNIEIKQDALLRDLITINKKIKSQTTKMANVQKEVEIINAEIDRQKLEIKTMSKQLVESKKRLTTKIKAISKIKSGNLLQVALVHSNLADIEKSVKMMGIIASYDVQFINDYYEKKLELGRSIKNLNSRNEVLTKKEAHLAEQKLILEKDSASRVAWLEQVKKTKMFTETEIGKMRKNKSNSEFEDLGVFDIFSKETIVKNKGLLKPPMQGELSDAYGVNVSDSVIVNSSGIFLASTNIQGIKALFNAEVVFSGTIDGLGKVVILDHGDNYYSVYGNLNNITVKTKQVVRTGQMIAQSDFSPLFGSNGLYFEIRHYSQSLNPRDWIRSFHESN